MEKVDQLTFMRPTSTDVDSVVAGSLVQIAEALVKLANDVAWIRQHAAHLRGQQEASRRG